MIYCGVDPGLSGAIAAIDGKGNLVSVQDAPVIEVKKGKGKRRAYVESAMAALLDALNQFPFPALNQFPFPTKYGDVGPQPIPVAGAITMLVLENVHAMPGQGVTSMFSMGFGMGLWLGVVAALRIPHQRVEPRIWKAEFGLSSDKGKSLIVASRLFPAAPLSRKKDEGRAEALLLAEWLRRQCQKPR